ncbi:MAG: heme-dependent oxidative N-demethylase subunit alpha family protein [Myxococcota bacterium]
MAEPLYFPVEDAPLRMVPSLNRFGTDFGMGAADRQFFIADGARARYLREKAAAPRSRRFVAGDDAMADAARSEAVAWMCATLRAEHPEVGAEVDDAIGHGAAGAFDIIADRVQEDFAVLHAGDDDAGRTLVIDVRFPSGWRPERLREEGFIAIHEPVPGFPPHARAARAMVRAMVQKGPYVRFVWTACPDGALDRHPDRAATFARWETTRDVHFRVERQVTVPLPQTRSSVFLIRVYHTPIAVLDPGRRAVLQRAMAQLPDDVRAYKGLPSTEVFAAAVARSV